MDLPPLVGVVEGKTTLLPGLRAYADALGRPLDHLARFIAWQVRCSVVLYPTTVVVNAPLAPEAPQQLLAAYVQHCVRCPTCQTLSSPLDACAACHAPRPDPLPWESHSQVAEVLPDDPPTPSAE